MRFQTFGPFPLPHLVSLGLAVGYLGCNGTEPFAPDGLADLPTAAAVVGNQLTPPSNANAVATSVGAITITWQDNSTNESTFEIHRSMTGATGAFTLLTSTGADIAAHTDQPLTVDVEHCYRIRSARLTGKKTTYSAFSSTVCATTFSTWPLAATATPLSSVAVSVQWNAVGSSVRIDRSTDGGASWTVAAGTTTSFRSFTADVSSEQEVCFRVVLYLSTYAQQSNTACTVAPAAPTAVTIIVTDGITDLTWIDNSGVEDGYEVWARFDDCYMESCFGTVDYVVAVLPANATSYRLVTAYPYSTTVFAMKDGGRSSGGGSPSP